jgi:hypothetical protein
MAIFATYAAYLAISIGLTIAAGSALSRSGKVFLTGVLGGDERLAGAVSRLLVVCFCLLNLGFVTRTVSTSGQISGARQAFGVLFSKVGAELLVLGALQAASIAVLTRFRRRQRPGPDPAPGPASPPPRPAGPAARPAAPGPGTAVTFREAVH